MVSFVNLIILGDYFYSHQYQQELQIVYYQKETGAILFEKNILDASLGVSFFQGKKYLQNQQIQDEMFKLKPFIPHFKECLRLYSLIRFDKLAFKMILQTCLQNDLEMEPEQYFMKTYPNFGLKEDYIQKLFLDVKEESK